MIEFEALEERDTNAAVREELDNYGGSTVVLIEDRHGNLHRIEQITEGGVYGSERAIRIVVGDKINF